MSPQFPLPRTADQVGTPPDQRVPGAGIPSESDADGWPHGLAPAKILDPTCLRSPPSVAKTSTTTTPTTVQPRETGSAPKPSSSPPLSPILQVHPLLPCVCSHQAKPVPALQPRRLLSLLSCCFFPPLPFSCILGSSLSIRLPVWPVHQHTHHTHTHTHQPSVARPHCAIWSLLCLNYLQPTTPYK
ncbi:hypothetical protein CDEST_05485 [Colletotrichum destructivum]|uniref:Uncharacterized protein n=1 Tax=Colletotrichum destructivum TaxID=34406 RepID=A0AAX4IBT0_9PEZI|nr:hypothetical protein CDEST_05485 [Colletotrichum destructivum]